MGLKLTKPTRNQEPEVRAVVKRCGKFVSTYSAIRDLDAYFDKEWVGLLYQGDEPVGFYVIRHGSRNNWTTVYEIGVVPEARRQGLARRMLDHLLQESPHHRIRLVCDARNDEAIRFYADYGFTKIGERENKAGEKIIDLEVVA